MGCEGVDDKLRKGGPIVANVITDSDETVLLMVSPGKALDDMIVNDEGGQLTGEAPY